jgi:hypothetical protein
VDFRIGWLHAKSGHKLDCQLQFCSLYSEGAGRQIGEYMEQLWVSPLTICQHPPPPKAKRPCCCALAWSVCSQ